MTTTCAVTENYSEFDPVPDGFSWSERGGLRGKFANLRNKVFGVCLIAGTLAAGTYIASPDTLFDEEAIATREKTLEQTLGGIVYASMHDGTEVPVATNLTAVLPSRPTDTSHIYEPALIDPILVTRDGQEYLVTAKSPSRISIVPISEVAGFCRPADTEVTTQPIALGYKSFTNSIGKSGIARDVLDIKGLPGRCDVTVSREEVDRAFSHALVLSTGSY
jgi:hypothetical protein